MNILFMCVGNSARSQIAEGLAKAMLNQGHQIQSAGSIPSGTVHSGAIACMESIGIDISQHYSKSIDELDAEFMNNLDYVITLKENKENKEIGKDNGIHARNFVSLNYSKKEVLKQFKNTFISLIK